MKINHLHISQKGENCFVWQSLSIASALKLESFSQTESIGIGTIRGSSPLPSFLSPGGRCLDSYENGVLMHARRLYYHEHVHAGSTFCTFEYV